jgi:hypothetical protein
MNDRPKIKENATINAQIKMLATLAKLMDDDPRPALDVMTSYLNFSGDQLRIFITEYRRKDSGDDPLEV